MKFSTRLKTLMVAAAAVVILAAPAYSWDHDYNSGWERRGYYRSSAYQYYPGYHRHYRGGYDDRPYARRHHGGVPFGIVLPGFSVFIGP